MFLGLSAKGRPIFLFSMFLTSLFIVITLIINVVIT